jgi:heavy metal translocating P-type ATPase
MDLSKGTWSFDRLGRVHYIIRRYPLPVLSFMGLLIGGILTVIFGDPLLGKWVWYATVIIGGLPVVAKTAISVSKRKFSADIIASLAIITAILTDEAFAGIIIVLMQTGGEAIEDYGFRRASSSLEELISRAPRMARRKLNSIVEEVKIEDVKVGDILMVRPGDLVPVDGQVNEGVAALDESAVTGEPMPVTKKVGDQLLSGTVNVGSAFEMLATRVSSESEYSKIVDLVRRAQSEKSAIQRIANRYAVWFTPLTVLVAVLSYALSRNVDTLLAVLVVATPCPLILATPIAVISGVNRAAKAGVIVKSGSAMEQIGRGRVAIFDKTGTLTYGTPDFTQVITFEGEEDEMLKIAASLEQLSSHPVAVAIAREGRRRFGELLQVTDFMENPGRGVEGRINGKHIAVGSQTFIETSIHKTLNRELYPILQGRKREGSLVSFIAIDHVLTGVILFTDKLREGVPQFIRELKELGIKETVMLTGDSYANAEVIADEAGVGEFEANLLPSQKVAAVRKLTEKYKSSIMVGDGINDAPALATATIGIAMGAHGTGISSEAADVVLLVDDVTRVGAAIAIGQRMLKIAKQSIFFGMGGSIVMMIIASFGYIAPSEGAILQEILDIAVILNALRVRHEGRFSGNLNVALPGQRGIGK